MRTDKIDSDFNFGACRYNNCLAFEQYDYAKGRYNIIVFTDVSYKRFKARKDSWSKTLGKVRGYRDSKIIFITNKQLMDMIHPLADYHFMKAVRNLVFDAKLGTTYEANRKHGSSTGSYFWCLSSDITEIYPRKRVRQS
jgi:uncharacterized protein YlbG (UPF0298 family)